MSSEISDIDIMMMGKTGAGKSRTGNALLGRKVFSTVGNMSSITKISEKDYVKLQDGRVLGVVDTPGVGDTRGTKEDGEKMFMDAVTAAIVSNSAGYHALIMVLKFGQRFTKEDLETVEYLKKVFGETFVSKYCIIVMSCGDLFQAELEDGNITGTFEEWCQNQKGPFSLLLKEVNGRVILFDNRAKEDTLNEQRQKLVDLIDRLMLGGRRYTDEKFEKARKEYEKQIQEKKISILTEKIQKDLGLIMQELEQNQKETDIVKKQTKLNEIMEKLTELNKAIDGEGQPTLDLVNLRVVVSQAQSKVEIEKMVLTTLQIVQQKEREDSKNKTENETEKEYLKQEIQELKRQLHDQTANLKKTGEVLEKKYVETRNENNSKKCIVM